MAGKAKGLTDTGVRSAKLAAGLHSDGGGLYLSVTASGSKSWRFIWKRDGKRREMGLGGYPAISLATARELAFTARRDVAEGRDPIAERKQANQTAAQEPTFAECAEKFLSSMEASWRNEKHRAQWRMTLTEYCGPFANKKISQVNTEAVLGVLAPIWTAKAETASRLRGRIERVWNYGKARGWVTGQNPALWRGHLKSLLPARQRLQRGHHAALPYADLPAFMVDLRNRKAMSARALEFLILTAARSGEVRGTTWAEIDLDAALWTVPPNRMKMAREHRVPLVGRALEIVRELSEARTGEFVFPGQKLDKPLSDMVFELLFRRMGVDDITAHGMRSAFRDWCGNETAFSREIAEAALAHQTGDATERAYRRSDALEKRRALMTAWDAFCTSAPAGANVVQMTRPEAATA